MKKLLSLSVFFPTYNDAIILPYFMTRLYFILPTVAKKYEVIAVDDGSRDNTYEVLLMMQKKLPNLHIVRHKRNKGYGAAIKSGIRACRYEWVFYTDSDGQYDPVELVKFVNKVTPEIDVVQGIKLKRNDNVVRKILGDLYNTSVHVAYSVPVRDVDCDFRLIRRSFLNKIKLTANSGIICLELVLKLARAGAIFTELPVTHHARLIGKSRFFRPIPLFKTAVEQFRFYRKWQYQGRMSK